MTAPAYQGPYVCAHCGRLWPCPTTTRLRPPYLWPAGTSYQAQRDWVRVSDAA